jgi:type II secretory pathway pseudopilin PulG
VRRTSGFTLLEAIISATILAGALSLALSVFGTLSANVADEAISSDVRSRARDARLFLESVLRGVRMVANTTPVKTSPHPTLNTQFLGLNYNSVIGYDTATQTLTLSPNRTISFTIESGETLNDVDDDGDGLVDEGTVFWRNGVSLPREVARGVDGSSFTCRFFKANSTEAASATTPDDTDVELVVSLTIQQRARQAVRAQAASTLGLVERATETVRVGIRNR